MACQPFPGISPSLTGDVSTRFFSTAVGSCVAWSLPPAPGGPPPGPGGPPVPGRPPPEIPGGRDTCADAGDIPAPPTMTTRTAAAPTASAAPHHGRGPAVRAACFADAT